MPWGAAVLCLLLSARALAAIPPYTRPLCDQAHILSTQQAYRIEDELWRLRRELGVQVAALTVPNLGDEPIEVFALKVAEQWKLGSSGLDDGLLILLDANSHKMRLEVGYGLESFVPDAVASDILLSAPPALAAGQGGAGDAERLAAVVLRLAERLQGQSEELRAVRASFEAKRRLGPVDQQTLLFLKVGLGLALVLWLTLGARYMARLPHRPVDAQGAPTRRQDVSTSRFFAAMLDALMFARLFGGRDRSDRDDRGGGGRFGGGGASGG